MRKPLAELRDRVNWMRCAFFAYLISAYVAGWFVVRRVTLMSDTPVDDVSMIVAGVVWLFSPITVPLVALGCVMQFIGSLILGG